VDEFDRNVIRLWLHANDILGPDRIALQALIDICEFSGPKGLSYCTWDLENGFYALVSSRRSGPDLSPIFCYGPVGESEITFLAGARLDENKQLKPLYAVGIAEENLEELRKHPNRWRREPII